MTPANPAIPRRDLPRRAGLRGGEPCQIAPIAPHRVPATPRVDQITQKLADRHREWVPLGHHHPPAP